MVVCVWVKKTLKGFVHMCLNAFLKLKQFQETHHPYHKKVVIAATLSVTEQRRLGSVDNTGYYAEGELSV